MHDVAIGVVPEKESRGGAHYDVAQTFAGKVRGRGCTLAPPRPLLNTACGANPVSSVRTVADVTRRRRGQRT